MMKLPQLCHGRTLSRLHPADVASRIIDEMRVRRGKGSVFLLIASTETPHRFDVEAVVNDITPEQALEALHIAATQIARLHGLPLRNAPVIAAADYDQLKATAERLVDKCRSLGWWEKVLGMERFIRSAAQFRHEREACVRDLVGALNEQRRSTPQILQAAE